MSPTITPWQAHKINVSEVHILKVIVEKNIYWCIHTKKSHPVPLSLSEFSKLKTGISYHHKTVQVGSDLRKPLVQPPAQIRTSYGIRPESIGLWSVKYWKPSRRESAQLLWATSSTAWLSLKWTSQSASILFQLVPIASHPLTILHCEESDYMKTTSKTTFSQAWMGPDPPASPQRANAPALMAVVPQHWIHFRFLMFLLHWREWGAAGITGVSKSALRIAE